MSDVFISYSRKDKGFVQKLHGALAQLDRDVWIDWEDIPLTANWWSEICAGIEAANTFVFVISPDSVRSEVCRKEIEHAANHHKRFVPILYQAVVTEEDQQHIEAAVSAHNWIFFDKEDLFESAFDQLIKALDADLAHIREHTRLLVRALDWDKQLRTRGLLLNSEETRQAETWLAAAVSKHPPPTDVHTAYILASRRQENQRQRSLLAGVSVALVVALSLAALSFLLFQQSEERRVLADNNAATAVIAQNNSEIQAEIAENNAATALAAQSTSEFNAQQAATQAVVAQNEANLNATAQAVAQEEALNRATQQRIAEDNAAIATIAQGQAQQNANEAETQAAIAQQEANLNATAQAVAQEQASNRATQQRIAEDNAAIATIAQGQAQQNANEAETQAAIAQQEANLNATAQAVAQEEALSRATQQIRAENSAATAAAAQSTSDFNAREAVTQAAAAQNNAATAVYQGDIAQSIALAAQSQLELRTGSSDLAGLLALEALTRYPYTYQAEQALGLAVLNNRLQKVLDAPEIIPEGVVWSPDGTRLIAVGEGTGTAIVWDVNTGRRIQTLRHPRFLGDVAWSPDGARIATGGLDGVVKIWDVVTGRELTALTGHNRWISTVEWSNDGNRVLTSSGDGTARIWDVTSGTRRLTLNVSSRSAETALWSPDETRILTISDFDTLTEQGANLKVWYTSNGALLLDLAGEGISSADWSPDSVRFVTGSTNGTVSIWDAVSGRHVSDLPRRSFAMVHDVAWSPDGRSIAIATVDNTVIVWDIELNQEVFRLFDVVIGGVYGVEDVINWSPDSTRLATTGTGVSVWRATPGTDLHTLAGHTKTVSNAVWSPDGTRIVTTSADGTARVWDTATGQQLVVFDKHSTSVWAADWSPDGARIVTGSTSQFNVQGFTVIWDAATGEEMVRLEGEIFGGTGLAWSPDGLYIGMKSTTENRQWDALTGQEVTSIGLLPDFSSWFYLTGFPRMSRISLERSAVEIFDMSSGLVLYTLTGHTGDINRTSLSPDGQFVATASVDGTARIWRVWQSTQDLVDYAQTCCVLRELTEQERERFNIPSP